MSVSWNGTTSKLVNTTANLAITTQITISLWVFIDTGNTVSDRLVCLDEDNNSFQYYHTAANRLDFLPKWTTGATFTFPVVDSAWNAVSVSYDGALTSNIPIARVGFASATVTTATGATGSFTQPLTGYCIGNRNAGDRGFNGKLQHVQVWNSILSAADKDKSLQFPGSVTSGLKLWLPLRDTTQITDVSGNGFDGTATALSDAAGEPQCGRIRKLDLRRRMAA